MSSSRKGGRPSNELSGNRPSGTSKKGARTVEIDAPNNTLSVVFIGDGQYIVGGDQHGMLRLWRVEDGLEVGTPIEVGDSVGDIQGFHGPDKLPLVVIGTDGGWVMVWNVDRHEKEVEFKPGHNGRVNAVDVSPDCADIVTGSDDRMVYVWSLSSGKRRFGPWKHDHCVIAAKFSLDGNYIATATDERSSVRVYDSVNGRLLVDFPIEISPCENQSLAWANSTHLFAISSNGNLYCLDASTGTCLSQWHVHDDPDSIAMASNGAFVAVSSGSSVWFWDIRTHKRIGSVIKHGGEVNCLSISSKHDLLSTTNKKITLRCLYDILPSSYFSDVTLKQRIRRTNMDDDNTEVTRESLLDNARTIYEKTVKKARNELADIKHDAKKKDDCNETTNSLRVQDEKSKEKIASLEETLQELRQELTTCQNAAKSKENGLNETINSLRARDQSLSSSKDKIANLEETVRELRHELTVANQTEKGLNETIKSLHVRDENSSSKVSDLEKINQQLADSQRKADNLVRVHEQKHHCEVLYAEGRIVDATKSLLQIKNIMSEEVKTNKLIIGWIADFGNRCQSALEVIGDKASKVKKCDEALAAYSAALSLDSSAPNNLLIKWVSTMLIRGPANAALDTAIKLNIPKSLIYQTVCDVLERDGRIAEAIEFFYRMQNELVGDTSIRTAWETEFRGRCVGKLEKLGDTATDSQLHDEAIKYYSDALKLDPANLSDILFKRSKAQAATGSWEDALIDADKVIELDPTSHEGYERKYAALYGMKRYKEAFGAFEAMRSMIQQSSDLHVRELSQKYVDATFTIRKVIEQTTRHMPRVLINTTSGRLYDKEQQAAAFEELPIFDELRSSMTTQIDRTRIRTAVKAFYRYVMFSHRWDYGEPLFQQVENISVYELEPSLANIKLQTFSRLIDALGFHWVWSDTCCIDKKDNVVLQESLVAMFTWYRGSSLTIVYLRGILSHSQKPGDLRKSIWNTRAWTYQEYVAAETVLFYTEDWKPYLGLEVFNHKESPAIITEMQQAAGAFTEELAVLRPGLDRVREKLYLASNRHTTLVEDIAYSLLGIFNAAIPVIYGEGNRAVGRLLEHILAGSGDVTILAWTGRSGSYNSCLPPDLAVYDQLIPPHIPQPIDDAEMANLITALESSLPDLAVAMMLYDQLNKLPSPIFTASRLSLPSIVFSIAQLDDLDLDLDLDFDCRIYRATISALGEVEIKTMENLSGMKDLLLVHPWICPLLDQEFSHGAATLDDRTRALRFVARLRQPFGALLLEPVSRSRYRRIAADCLIMVQVREEVPMDELIGGIRTIDIQ